jgi:hypothetical protein
MFAWAEDLAGRHYRFVRKMGKLRICGHPALLQGQLRQACGAASGKDSRHKGDAGEASRRRQACDAALADI